MAINNYRVGTLVTVTGSFTDLNGNPATPSAVTLRMQDPTNVETVITTTSLTAGSTAGVYSYSLVPLIAGMWLYRFEGTGAVVATEDSSFNVLPSQFGDAA
jgi:hypothetical protein